MYEEDGAGTVETLLPDIKKTLDALASASGSRPARNETGVLSDLKGIVSGTSSPKLTSTVQALVNSTTDNVLLGYKFVARIAGIAGEVTSDSRMMFTRYTINDKIIYAGSGMTAAGVSASVAEFNTGVARIGSALRAAV